jgi:hypothetical protein
MTTTVEISQHGARVLDDTFGLWGEKYQQREAKGFGSLPFLACLICGRDTSKQGNSNGVIVSGGGSTIVHPEDAHKEVVSGGYMGWFPIGSECIKAIPSEFRHKNPYDDKVKGVNNDDRRI